VVANMSAGLISRCIIDNNLEPGDNDYQHSMVRLVDGGTVENTLFYNNTTKNFGTITLQGPGIVRNCTFVGNTNREAQVYIASDKASVINCAGAAGGAVRYRRSLVNARPQRWSTPSPAVTFSTHAPSNFPRRPRAPERIGSERGERNCRQVATGSREGECVCDKGSPTRVARTFLSARVWAGRQECLPHTTTLHRCGQPGRRRPSSSGTVSLCRRGGLGGSVQTQPGEREAATLEHAVPGGNVLHSCAFQLTAETAGSSAHRKRTQRTELTTSSDRLERGRMRLRQRQSHQSGADIPVCAGMRGQTGMSAPHYHAPSLRPAGTASPFE
jgi:hypothetical protein